MEFVPIIKPVGGICNLNCSYCYFRQKQIGINNSSRMNNEILRNLIDYSCQFKSATEFIWHGGEPLLVGIDFYRKAVQYQAKWVTQGHRVLNSIQTNGILIDKLWIEFLVSNGFTVGVSLDGPANITAKTRLSKRGHTYHERILRNIRLLQEAKILSGIICCVSSVNHDSPESILNFFIQQGINRIKFLQVQGRTARGCLLPYSISGEQYAKFLIRIYKEWLRTDDPKIEIREINSIINAMLGGTQRECVFAGECYKYFTVYPDGSIYGCDSLPKVESLRFGHISDNPEQLRASANLSRFKNRLRELKILCEHCHWFTICRGGCLQDWWPNIFNSRTKNQYCEGLKMIFSTIQKSLKAHQLI